MSLTIVPSPLLPVIKLWLQEFSEDLYEPPEHQALRLLCGHLRHRLSFRRLARTAESLLKKFQEKGIQRRGYMSNLFAFLNL